jgi:hypothetical protein
MAALTISSVSLFGMSVGASFDYRCTNLRLFILAATAASYSIYVVWTQKCFGCEPVLQGRQKVFVCRVDAPPSEVLPRRSRMA